MRYYIWPYLLYMKVIRQRKFFRNYVVKKKLNCNCDRTFFSCHIQITYIDKLLRYVVIVYTLINQILLGTLVSRHTQPISSSNFSFFDQQSINLNARYIHISLLVLQCTRVRSAKNIKHTLCWLAQSP